MSPADRPALVKRPPTHPADPDPAAMATTTPPPAPISPPPLARAQTAPRGAEVLLAVRVPAELRRWYKQASLDHDRSMRELIIAALEEYQGKLASKLANKTTS
jgi:hypothetical protein